ncbi:hypothetical protein EYF80_009560 [Liparis tanakae]|uniref:Uncharacterized protein n=1 Tax=Liparis tanakae TaxID=230148 RepID=A0A4Z2IQP6_9TELE|nr:hypothetical protein EYF80_009560 [Liparis tanakae]
MLNPGLQLHVHRVQRAVRCSLGVSSSRPRPQAAPPVPARLFDVNTPPRARRVAARRRRGGSQRAPQWDGGEGAAKWRNAAVVTWKDADCEARRSESRCSAEDQHVDRGADSPPPGCGALRPGCACALRSTPHLLNPNEEAGDLGEEQGDVEARVGLLRLRTRRGERNFQETSQITRGSSLGCMGHRVCSEDKSERGGEKERRRGKRAGEEEERRRLEVRELITCPSGVSQRRRAARGARRAVRGARRVRSCGDEKGAAERMETSHCARCGHRLREFPVPLEIHKKRDRQTAEGEAVRVA